MSWKKAKVGFNISTPMDNLRIAQIARDMPMCFGFPMIVSFGTLSIHIPIDSLADFIPCHMSLAM
jgi:hypothetical protein